MGTDELVKIKSGVSQAYWCDTSDTIATFQPAKLTFDTPGTQSLSWFDKLFEGGLSLPSGNSNTLRPLTMLVSGRRLWKDNANNRIVLPLGRQRSRK